jgi:hypothetical protein
MKNCPAYTLFPAKGCPAYRSSPVSSLSQTRKLKLKANRESIESADKALNLIKLVLEHLAEYMI